MTEQELLDPGEENKIIKVEDSKEGWCEAYKLLIENLYNGIICQWDVSLVRPAGAPLKTFGGRASGPGPLIDLFQYTVDKFIQAAVVVSLSLLKPTISCVRLVR